MLNYQEIDFENIVLETVAKYDKQTKTVKHYINIEDIDTDTLNYIMKISKQIYDLLMKKLSPDGITLIQNNGLPQVVKHYHLHLIPKYKNKIKEDIKSVFDKITK